MHERRPRKSRNRFNLSVLEVDNGFTIDTHTSEGVKTYVIQKESDNISEFDKLMDICKFLYENSKESNDNSDFKFN